MLPYKEGYRYQTQAFFYFMLSEIFRGVDITAPYARLFGGQLNIMERYAWDGASFFLFTWFGTPKAWLLASLIHDVLYQLMQDGLLDLSYRKHADTLFYHILRAHGVNVVFAYLAYLAVKFCGNYFARHGKRTYELS